MSFPCHRYQHNWVILFPTGRAYSGGLGIRHVQVMAISIAACMAFLLRANLSVAIVAMVDTKDPAPLAPVSAHELSKQTPSFTVMILPFVADIWLGWDNARICAEFLLLGVLHITNSSGTLDNEVRWSPLPSCLNLWIRCVVSGISSICLLGRMAVGMCKQDASRTDSGNF